MPTPSFGLNTLSPGQSNASTLYNLSMFALDGLVHLSALDRNATNPPSTPVAGDTYLTGVGATGVWAGNDLKVAIYTGTGWLYVTPKIGMLAWVQDESAMYRWTGTTWTTFTTGGGGSAPATGFFRSTTAQSIASGSPINVALPTAVATGSLVTQTNSTDYTVNETGLYEISYSVGIFANAGSASWRNVQANLTNNGTLITGSEGYGFVFPSGSSGPDFSTITRNLVVSLTSTNVIRLRCTLLTGGSAVQTVANTGSLFFRRV